MNKQKIYSAVWTGTVAAGANQNINGLITNTQRELAIRSITWDWKCRDNATTMLLPFATQTTQEILLSIGAYNVNFPVAEAFTPAAPLAPASNGGLIWLYTPGKRNFQNFYASNGLQFQFVQANHDPLNAVDIAFSLIVEIEEL